MRFPPLPFFTGKDFSERSCPSPGTSLSPVVGLPRRLGEMVSRSEGGWGPFRRQVQVLSALSFFLALVQRPKPRPT